MKNLNEASAFSGKSPYEIYQEWEEIPVYKDFILPDLLELKLGDWARNGGKAAFANMDGAGGTCDVLIEEIAPGSELKPQRHMYEKAIFVLEGQGATTIWNEGGKKHTLEWQKGSLFSTPLNTWHQHFNAQGKTPVRMVSLTDAPVIINRYRNLDYVFNNNFIFGDRYSGGADEWGKGGRYLPEVKRGRVWESNFIADLWGFQPKDYKERGGDNRTTLFEFVDNTMSAHISEFPVGKYKKAHRHGAGAHIVMLTGSGYSFLWPEGEYGTKKRVEWGRMSMFVPPMQWWHQHFNPGPEPARYLALKPWGFKFKVEELKDTGEDVKKGGAQIEYEDQNPEIHKIFTAECVRRGAETRMPMFGT
ncbi:MAG TPA: cupin domain-containing protein [Candidatus Binatia bacterium]|jgi:quercetin dioxygenase-like cupin family protein|nr:cupin domain-containing protein [Candidatus Binatia bacterium]